MLRKVIKYTDFDGNEREEAFYFNLTEAELSMMEASVSGGITKLLEDIVATQDKPKLVEFFTSFILTAYGKKSPDGVRFIKSQELRDSFAQTQAYSDLYMELTTNEQAAAAFVNALIPQNVLDRMNKQVS